MTGGLPKVHSIDKIEIEHKGLPAVDMDDIGMQTQNSSYSNTNRQRSVSQRSNSHYEEYTGLPKIYDDQTIDAADNVCHIYFFFFSFLVFLVFFGVFWCFCVFLPLC